MAGNSSDEEGIHIDWTTDDELEIESIPNSSIGNGIMPRENAIYGNGNGIMPCENAIYGNGTMPRENAIYGNGIMPREDSIFENGEASSSTGPSQSYLIHHFTTMSFSEKLVRNAIEDNEMQLKKCEAEEEKINLILNTLLTYSALEDSPPRQGAPNPDQCSSGYEENLLDGFSDSDSNWSGNELTEENTISSERKRTLLSLQNMGYSVQEASIAINRCGLEASMAELTDFLCAAQLVKSEDMYYEELPIEKPKNSKLKKRSYNSELSKNKKQKAYDGDNETIRIPKPMIGFGVPGEMCLNYRKIPEAAMGPPFFYYENVALAPKGVWDTISRFLYDVEPEFVDSKYFCAAARKRGYIHNLPIVNRYPLLPMPPRTISDALPLTRRWWPSWDSRTKLNCLQTCIGSAKLTERIRRAVEDWGDNDPPISVQRYVMDECRKWNLVWVGKNKVAPLECDEVEMLLGFPKNHTRGISRTDRYKSLGNSFQVDTVAYHLSVLKDLYPGGINMLSLFSGIGGAEVALYRLGVPLKNVVSVEKSEVNRRVVKGWWEQTNQPGNLIHIDDVQEVQADRLEKYMNAFGGFDLVIGGSPCNNLAGSNRVSRDGLEGEHSSLFYDYFRILDLVKGIMNRL